MTFSDRRDRPVTAVLSFLPYFAFAICSWYLTLNFAKTPLIPQLDASWIAALTFAAADKLQFGRDVIFTYGPLCHLAFSTYAPSLFIPDLFLELGIKAIYVATLVILSMRMSAARRCGFLIVATLVAVVSYQVIYFFTITCLAICLACQSRSSLILALPLLAFAAVASLVKLTFLWAAVLVIACGVFFALLEGRVILALIAPVVYSGFFALGWHLAGQTLGALPDFLRNGVDVTTGYAATMSRPPSAGALIAAVVVLAAVIAQLVMCFKHAERNRQNWAVVISVAVVLFLAWKLGFSRAGGHIAEFFYYAMLLSLGARLLFRPALFHKPGLIETGLAAVVIMTSCSSILLEVPGTFSTLVTVLRARWTSNIWTLISPGRQCAKYEARDIQLAKTYELPRIKQTVGRDTVDVLGYEQAIALLNGLNYTPNPVVQTYCAYTPRLATINGDFYRSSAAPKHAIFKLQPIDNRLPTLDCADVLVSLATRYLPLFSEKGYLLFQLTKAPPCGQVIKAPISDSEFTVGQTIDVPPGAVWCEIDLPDSFIGKVISFIYQAPTVEVELNMDNGKASRRRFLPTLAHSGFLINPVPFNAADFLDFISGEPNPAITVRSFKIVNNGIVQLFYKHTTRCRFWSLPQLTTRNPRIAALATDLRGYADVLGHPAAQITTHIPVERFFVQGREFLLVHPTGEVRLDIPAQAAHVRGEFAMKEESYTMGNTAGATFQVEFVPRIPNAGRTVFCRRILAPLTTAGDREVQRFEADLPRDSEGQLALRTLPGPSGKIDWAWTGWSNIEFTDLSGRKLQ